MSNPDPYELRAKYTRFRILVIGRANAGKTTLLKRVCNTAEDPCIYDENNKNLLEPTTERGIHDIHRPFAFKSNPQFIFHDSPGFETGDKKQLQEVLSFIEKKAKATGVDDQLHAIWFCFVLNNARPLLPLETEFFETARAGRVPVIAIFTKFDDLMTQIYDINQDDDLNRQTAEEQVEQRFRKPLYGYTFPPRADVCFEDLHNSETSKHQDQVKVLIERTASSLDDTALKMLFVSVQRNIIELAVQYAIGEVLYRIGNLNTEDVAWQTMLWFGHSYIPGYNYNYRIQQIIFQRDQRRDQHQRIQKACALAAFLRLDANFNLNSSSHLKKSNLLIFTALLICLENTFWTIHRLGDHDGNFVDLFKQSFTLYVESGMRKKVEAALEQGGWTTMTWMQVTVTWTARKDFEEKFCKMIVGHYLSHSDSDLEDQAIVGKEDLAAKDDAKNL